MINRIPEENKNSTGVYKITNIINGNFYIGSTIEGFAKRYCKYKSSYKCYLRGKRKIHPRLFNAFNKYGIENFIYELIVVEKDKSKVRELEEYYIQEMNPIYTICRIPTRGGAPNKGRKQSAIWKKRIGDRSKEFRHSEESLTKVTENNKKGACVIVFENESERLEFKSWENVRAHFNLKGVKNTRSNLYNKKKYKGYKLVIITRQRKRIKVFTEEGTLEFDSLNKCDKHFNMWRGYTSTITLRNELIMDKYKYEIL